MKNLNSPNKIIPFAFPVMAFLVVILTVSFYLMPAVNGIADVNREIKENQETLAALTTKVSALEGFDDVELKTKTDLLLKVLPAEKDAPAVLMAVKAMGADSGVIVEEVGIDPGEVSTGSAEQVAAKIADPKYEMPITISASGSKESLKSFLSSMESTFPLFAVSKVNFFISGGDLLRSSIVLSTYYLPLPKELGDVKSALPVINQEEERAYQRVTTYKVIPSFQEPGAVQSGKENPFSI